MPTTKQKNLVKKWVAALRSGKYKQGKGVLRSEKGNYCCLGVLCDIVNPKGWNKKPTDTCNGSAFKHKLDDSTGEMIHPGHYQRLTGLRELAPDVLAIKNDDRTRFTTLANIIEKAMEEAVERAEY